MGAVKVCVHKTTKSPYFVEATGIYLFSVEELAYYLAENIYLIDERIVGEKLYSWIEWELEMPHLAEKLRAGSNTGTHVYNQVMAILQTAEYHSEQEILELSEKIKTISGLQTQERMKYKADELMQNENYWAAITEYDRLLSIRQSSRLSVEFYATVWNNLGGCYARLFMFAKAADCFAKAYQFQKVTEYKERAAYALKLEAYTKEDHEEFCQQLESEAALESVKKQPEMFLKNWEKNYSKIACI